MIETEDYWIVDNILVFKPAFDGLLSSYEFDPEQYDRIIFSLYEDPLFAIQMDNERIRFEKYNCGFEQTDYWIYNNILIFKPYFNKPLESTHYDLIREYGEVIFSNFNDPETTIEKNNNYYDIKNDERIYYKIYSEFNQPIQLIEGLKKITFGYSFNQPIQLVEGLEEIIFGYEFNQPIQLVEGLKKITFGKEFNQPIELIEVLEEIVFGYDFDQPIELVSSIKKITFGYKFNESITLAEGLKEIVFGHDFDQHIELVNGLEKITFGKSFNQKIKLNEGLKKITFGYEFDEPVILIEGIEEINFGYKFNQPIELVEGLKKITFGNEFNQQIKLIEGIEEIGFGKKFSQRIELVEGIKKLTLDCNNISLIENLPNGIEELVLNYFFELELRDLPNSIKIIKFYSDCYDKDLNNLPLSLECLMLPFDYDLEISRHYPNLKTIICGHNYKFNINTNISDLEIIRYKWEDVLDNKI